MAKKSPGLTKRGKIWWINKSIRGYGPIRESTGTTSLAEAERILALRIEQIRRETVYGERPAMTFGQVADKYIEEACPPKSVERALYALDKVRPFIENLDVTMVHDGSLSEYRQARQKAGAAPGTINKELMVVTRILNLCARVWRHSNGRPYIDTPPLLQRVPGRSRGATVLSWSEQAELLKHLPSRQAEMALFAVNTGLRTEELCGLNWQWLVPVPDLMTEVFVLPAEVTKNGQDRVVVMNSIALSVLHAQPRLDIGPVFRNRFGNRYDRLYNGTWRRAREKAGVPTLRVHDLRHTFGHRLRAAGVGLEDRADLLGHATGRMTTHYSAPELGRLLEAAETIVTERPSTVLSSVRTKTAQSA